MLTSKAGARLPINRHGAGTQSLSVLFLFDAFLKSRLKKNYSNETVPILAIEEPEAHLHPSAIKSISDVLMKLSGQKIITTHSGQLLAGFPLESIRRISRVNNQLKVFQLKNGTLNKEDSRKINYHVRTHRSDLLFARAWLLVEGETDSIVFTEISRILGMDLYSKGVCCVEFAQIECAPIIKLAKDFGIDWYLVADGDDKGTAYCNSAKRYCSTGTEADHIKQLHHKNIEVFLCENGFGYMFEANIAPQNQSKITANKTTDPNSFWTQVVKNTKRDFRKGKAAMKVIAKMEDDPTLIPAEIKSIIEHVISLAEKCS